MPQAGDQVDALDGQLPGAHLAPPPHDLDRLAGAGVVEAGGRGDLEKARLQGTPARPPGNPQDTAHLIDFLCSPQCQWTNGQLLKSNGGSA